MLHFCINGISKIKNWFSFFLTPYLSTGTIGPRYARFPCRVITLYFTYHIETILQSIDQVFEITEENKKSESPLLALVRTRKVKKNYYFTRELSSLGSSQNL